MSDLAATISIQALRRFACDVLAARGMRPADAGTVADALVWADSRGVATHGVARLAQYCGFIDRGDLDPRAVMERAIDLPASARLDARRAAGPVAMMAAVEVAIEKARAAGVGMVLVSRTTHTGALGCYTQALARRGFAGVALCATNPFMVYHGAAAAGAGTNPIAIAVPAGGDEPIVFDMTTGATSMGNLAQARRSGRTLEPGLAADAQGQPVTDPQLARMVLPLGGAKGSGLSLMIELLASHLSGESVLAEALEKTPLGKTHRQNALLLAIDCSRFVSPALLAELGERLVRDIRALPPAQEGQSIRLPGERGDQEARRRDREGIPIPQAVLAELTALATASGIDLARYRD